MGDSCHLDANNLSIINNYRKTMFHGALSLKTLTKYSLVNDDEGLTSYISFVKLRLAKDRVINITPILIILVNGGMLYATGTSKM